ncbi:MAG: hypothetical protein SH850_08045 [Planctomycetaceae bacterium]|nr:hypothetical protein [Planctomycetaceae bacterium]
MVQCAKCGLLAVIDKHGIPGSAYRICRDKGHKTGEDRTPMFLCWRGKRHFSHEKGEGKAAQAGVVAELDQEIDCSYFVEWIESKTPKEHEDMASKDELLAIERRTLFRSSLMAVAVFVIGNLVVAAIKQVAGWG